MSEHREFFRKKLNAPAYLFEPTGEILFHVRDLSLDGFQGHFEFAPDCEVGDLRHVRIPELEIKRAATVMWIEPEEEGGYLVGFFFSKPA
ncbi:PilZ domain-containing protein [Methylomagnum sp.]